MKKKKKIKKKKKKSKTKIQTDFVGFSSYRTSVKCHNDQIGQNLDQMD